VADDAPFHDLSESSTPHAEDLPDRLRVHSLARVLGTTSRRVLDALSELDGRSRSAQSSVDRTEAARVRDVLANGPQQAETSPQVPEQNLEEPDVAEAPAVVDEEVPVVVDGTDLDADVNEQAPDSGEPESRLLLETAVEPADYLPLFVAPQPVTRKVAAKADDADDSDSDTDDDSDTETSEADDDTDSDDDQAERPANRRRRRGRRGRGRGRGEQGGDDSDNDGDTDAADGQSDSDEQTDSSDSDESDDSDDDDSDDETAGSEGATRRRRRRRRRKSGSGGDNDGSGSADDPPNTVVHERPPRSSGKKDSDAGEIQGISGSTRLEAKRQRRRDGRDAGRRRPPILSEAEFLARREAVERVMVVQDKVRTEPPHEGARYTQIAVLEDGIVVEHFVTSAACASLVGNIYLGIVQNVLPSMEAAFVDIGRGRNGVLYAGEVNWEAAGLGGAQRKIEQALKPGDYVVVQVSKDPVGHKGARLTTQVSLAGRYLVYVPGASSTGISRKLPDTERQRLKDILREVVPPNAGVIIRTASEGVKEDDIRSDVTRLQERWNQIEARAEEIKGKAAGAAVALYEEPDVLVKVIRDLFNEDFSGLIVSGDDAWGTITEYVNSVAPELVPRVTKYEPPSSDGQPGPNVFAVHRIDEQLVKAMDRKVWLPSGGTLVIDRTEAMTVVDVNTGKFTGSGGNLEQTVTRNNLEAAEEIVRQLRLRDIGGIIVIDFIDMVLESNRDLVLRRLTEALARDRTRHQVSEVTSLGLVQLTRKKLGTGLIEAFSSSCPHCGGRGILLHADPVDSAPTTGRGKSESGGRRGKRAKKGGKAEEPEVAKVPVHVPGEHPMFRAMAAANGRHEDDDEPGDETIADHDVTEDADVPEHDPAIVKEAVKELVEEDLEAFDEEDEDEDFDESDEDESGDDTDDEDSDEDSDDEDEIDVDLDEDDEDDDIEVINRESDDDSDDEDDSEVDELDDDSDDEEAREPVGVATAPEPVGRPRRRRAAARPAGPPIHEG
jgi:ribonuclease E